MFIEKVKDAAGTSVNSQLAAAPVFSLDDLAHIVSAEPIFKVN